MHTPMRMAQRTDVCIAFCGRRLLLSARCRPSVCGGASPHVKAREAPREKGLRAENPEWGGAAALARLLFFLLFLFLFALRAPLGQLRAHAHFFS
jgi:hypothetical protein